MDAQRRRRFLRFVASSPLLAAHAQQKPLADPKQAINVMDFEAAAREVLPPAHYGYLATGVDDDSTLRANRKAFEHWQLRPRRLVDVSKADLSVEVFGVRWPHPIALAPVGSQKAFHPQGELAVARAARATNTLQILSTVTTVGVEEVKAAAGQLWYQLYPTSKWEYTERIVKRAEDAGCPVLVFTVDLPVGRNTETEARFKRQDSRPCTACHLKNEKPFARKPMFAPFDMQGVTVYNSTLTWNAVSLLKKLTRMKIVVKGIETHDDAQRCLEHGADGIIVSNHGGRAEASGRGAIEWLPEVVSAVRGRVPVF
ncbi:MAG: alpha-hydroxy-acid oxidizing protein, partial [Bryobacterales bacterium]|nr:alpha-hydroxy-acid oxidizing protein [Bryobacterales bacterium]